jgi:hypothetical protein
MFRFLKQEKIQVRGARLKACGARFKAKGKPGKG